jgi:hypothetical protein
MVSRLGGRRAAKEILDRVPKAWYNGFKVGGRRAAKEILDRVPKAWYNRFIVDSSLTAAPPTPAENQGAPLN